MAKIKSFSKTECAIVTARVEKALKVLEAELGIAVSTGNGKYSTHEFKLTVVFTAGNKEDNEKAEWDRLCRLFGFKESDYRRKIKNHQGEFFLIGFKLASRKYPVLVQAVRGGKQYKMSADYVKGVIVSNEASKNFKV
jgi:hypothetical protein